MKKNVVTALVLCLMALLGATGMYMSGVLGRIAADMQNVSSGAVSRVESPSLGSGTINPETFTGVGGGYDPSVERAISALNDESIDTSISPSDAMAYNSAYTLSPFSDSDFTTNNGGAGVDSGKVWSAVILAFALMGLAAYAVSALMEYRKENEL